MSSIIKGSEPFFWQVGATGCLLLHGFSALLAKYSEYRFDPFPANCPGCSAPGRNHEVKWTGFQSANCPYCGNNLPMSKS